MKWSKMPYCLIVAVISLTLMAPVPAGAVAETDELAATQPGKVKTKPRIRFTSVPPRGSFANLRGQVENVDPAQYAVAVYIRVGRGWWTKPYWASPVTYIYADGTWECDITTGGIDEQANTILAFLIPKGYDPPLRSGQSNLPAKIRKVAVAKISVRRTGKK